MLLAKTHAVLKMTIFFYEQPLHSLEVRAACKIGSLSCSKTLNPKHYQQTTQAVTSLVESEE
jgi:hypothetical protein